MKDYLQSQIEGLRDPNQARNLVREYLQAQILSSLQRNGAMIPLAPYLFGAGPGALGASLLLTALALLVLGGCMSLFTGRDFWFSALRMMLIGLAAGAATYT